MLVEASMTPGGIDLACSVDSACIYRVNPPVAPA
jgi:hypothetical protein